MRPKIYVQSRIDVLGDNKGQWLNRFMSHHGIDVHYTGSVVEIIACYMLSENCDLIVTSGKFVVSMGPAPTNISPEFQALMAKLDA